jgi:glutamate synthase (ferredoxin)
MTGGIAIILGDFGRNFAAGMSGGIAYLFSDDGTFDDRKFNLEMVELEDLTEKDIDEVQGLIKNHINHTNSNRAKNILDDWEKNSKKFIKVMPTDYKKALEILEKEKEEAKVD